MKKILTSLIAIVALALLPYTLSVQASVTGTFSASVTVPNTPATTLTFPDLSGGINAGAEILATSTVEVTGTTGSTTDIMVGSTELLAASSSIAFDADASTTAADLAAAINVNSGISGYSATASGDTITITAPTGSGATLNGTTATFISDYLGNTTSFSGGSSAGASVSASAVSSPFSAVSTSTASTTDLDLSIGSTTITLSAGMTAAAAASSTADQINADSSNAYTASVTNTDEVMLTAKTSGSAGNGPVVASDLSYNGTAEVAVFTPADITAGETYRVTINGTDYDATADASSTVSSITATLAPQIDANAAVSCTEDGTAITCTSTTPGTAFTASASVLAALNVSGLSPVSVSSNNSISNSCAKAGDTVTLTFTSPQTLNASSTSVTINGATTTVSALGGNQYSATFTTDASTTPGTLTFFVTAVDTNGNTATTSATTDNSLVTFYNAAPTITLNGAGTIELANGASYNELGATSTDAFGNSLNVVTSGSVDTRLAGPHIVTYTATDCAGNTATTTRTINVDVLPASSGGSSSSSSSSSGSTTFGGIVTAEAFLLPPINIGPSAPLIPNTGVEGNTSAIATVKAELASLITQLIARLQAQISVTTQ